MQFRVFRSHATALIAIVAVAGCGGVGGSSLPITSSLSQPPPATPTIVRVKPAAHPRTQAKRLFIANAGNNTITEYAPPYTGAPINTISNTMSVPTSLAFNPKHRLFVVNDDLPGNATVTEYRRPYTGAPINTISISATNGANSIAFDPSGNLFVANSCCIGLGNGIINEYAPPYTGAPMATISNGFNDPLGMAFDSSGNLFVSWRQTVVEYAPPYTGAPVATISLAYNPSPGALALDAKGNLFVVQGTGCEGLPYCSPALILEYAPPYTGGPITTTGTGTNPYDLALDRSGNLFVSDGSFVYELRPPYTYSTVSATISQGLNNPQGLTFGP